VAGNPGHFPDEAWSWRIQQEYFCTMAVTTITVARGQLARHTHTQKPQTVIVDMDFISTSRCMLVEGGEVWINITSPMI
jgi:hypothetical protein